MNGAVFSSNGTLFSYLAGRVCSFRPKYDFIISTGNSLPIAAFASLEHYDELHSFMDNISNESIYSVKPFHNSAVSHTKALMRMYFKNKTSIGSTMEFANIFNAHYNELLYNSFHILRRTLKFSVYNMSDYKYELFSASDLSAKLISRFAAASMTVPILFEPIKINGTLYSSSMHTNTLPIIECINHGCKTIDVFTNITNKPYDDELSSPISRMWQSISRYHASLQQIELDDILGSDFKSLSLRIFYVPEHDSNEYNFSKKNVNKYFKEGYSDADIIDVKIFNL